MTVQGRNNAVGLKALIQPAVEYISGSDSSMMIAHNNHQAQQRVHMNSTQLRKGVDVEARRQQLLVNIKALQSELVKTSMQPAKDTLQYAQLLSALHAERDKLRALNRMR